MKLKLADLNIIRDMANVAFKDPKMPKNMDSQQMQVWLVLNGLQRLMLSKGVVPNFTTPEEDLLVHDAEDY